MYNLVISDDEGMTTVVPVVRDEITIGREEGNTIRLTERNVSRHHARIRRNEQMFVVIDLSSYNGVRINGTRIKGETRTTEGDRIQIGDYVLAIQTVGKAPVKPEIDDLASTVRLEATTLINAAAVRAPKPLLRLILLTGATRGAEYRVFEDELRIGRAEKLEMRLNHPSISREHARVTVKDGKVYLHDLNSANGVRVNGREVETVVIEPGDLLELGQVKVRAVAADAPFAVEADPESTVASVSLGFSRKPLLILAAVVTSAALVAVIIAIQAGRPSRPVGLRNDSQGNAEPSDIDPRLSSKTYSEALHNCRSALQAGRFEEAISYGTAALRLKSDDPAAASCKSEAEAALGEEQTFAKAKQHLERGDAETAYYYLQGLPLNSPFRTRSEAAEISRKFAETKLAKAQGIQLRSPEEAKRLVAEVLAMNPVPTGLDLRAKQLKAVLDKLGKPQAAAATTHTAQAQPRKPAVDPVASNDSAGNRDAFDSARECLARGDHRCAIAALEGKTRAPRELALLIETYRSVGELDKAVNKMQEFIRRFPQSRQAEYYRQFLEHQE